MRIDRELFFETKHSIMFKNSEPDMYYHFDYDEQDASANMKIQQFNVYYEVMIFLAPEGEFLFEGNLFHLSFGDIVLIPPYLLHAAIYRNGAPSKRIIIDFLYSEKMLQTNKGYSELLSIFHSQTHIYRFSRDERVVLYKKLNAILNYTLLPEYADRSIDRLMIHTMFVEFFHELYCLKDENRYQNDLALSPTTQKIYSIAAYIYHHSEEQMTLQTLGDMFYITPSYLSHIFKDVMGFALFDYLRRTRIKNVQYKLITTKDKVLDIANDCGFNNISHFHRTFLQIVGMSPLEYRNRFSGPDSIENAIAKEGQP